MLQQSYIEKEVQYNNTQIYSPLPVVISKAKGTYAWDVAGTKYQDFVAGEGSVNQGHCHPKIFETLQKQTAILPIATDRLIDDQIGPYKKLLCETFGYEKALLQTSEDEVCEAALKFSRRWGAKIKGIESDKVTILFALNSSRGNYLACTASSNDSSKYERFGPFENFRFENIQFNSSEELNTKLEENKNIAAFFLEPVQTREKFVIPDDGYLKRCREICDKHNVILVFNETFTGLGRTGKLLASDYEGVKPDVLLLGRSLCGGFHPTAALLANAKFARVFQIGLHGSSFGAATLSCSLGQTALKVLLNDGMVKNSAERGQQLLQLLLTLKSTLIKSVKGRGLLIAVELDEKAPNTAQGVVEKLVGSGILVRQAHKSNFILLTPPLIISQEEIKEAFGKIKTVILNL